MDSRNTAQEATARPAAQGWRIGDVADLLNLRPHVLRFWETEFPQLAPLRTGSGQRFYTKEHLAMLRRIKHLLHEQGMTIEGAKRVLEGIDTPPDMADAEFIAHIGLELAAICQLLEDGAPGLYQAVANGPQIPPGSEE